MSIQTTEIRRLDGSMTTIAELMGDRATLLVNVASECGLTPQYAGLQHLHEQFGPSGLAVVGVPCNQFEAQEPGTPDQIAEFCSVNYGVTFALTEKVNVNPPEQHAVYADLTHAPDDSGAAGDVEWNFEKFLLDRDGNVVRRIRPDTEPDDPMVIDAITSLLADQ
jgi:glutathione peroxidase